VTQGVGTMACAYLFALLACISLPAVLIAANALKRGDVPTFFTKQGLILIVSWVAQTFLQLVLLSIILVGQRVQSAASDARGVKEFKDTESIPNRLDTRTSGGITDVLQATKARERSLSRWLRDRRGQSRHALSSVRSLAVVGCSLGARRRENPANEPARRSELIAAIRQVLSRFSRLCAPA